MSKIEKVTKPQMLNDLQHVLYSVLEQFNHIYGGRAVIALVDRHSRDAVIRFDGRAEEHSSDLNLDDLAVTDYMTKIYDYAIDGRRDKQMDNDWEAIFGIVEPFFDELKHFQIFKNNADASPLATISHVLNIFSARLKLDDTIPAEDEDGNILEYEDGEYVEDSLHLKQVALLAGIDEKTARNLAHPDAKNRLVTHKRGRFTLVKKDFARGWLIRRGYNDTVEFDSSLDRNLEKRGFRSLADLGEYVRGHREKSDMTIESLGEKADLDSEGIAWLQQLELGQARFEKARLLAIATKLGIPPKAFVLAVLRIFLATQLRELEAQLPD